MTQTIKLDYPVTAEGQTIEEINLRRPKVRDMLAADKGAGSEAEKEIRMFANLAEVAPAIIEGLDLADYARLQESYKGFLSSVPPTPDERSCWGLDQLTAMDGEEMVAWLDALKQTSREPRRTSRAP